MAINRLPISIYFSGDNKLNGIIYIIIDFLGLANLLNTPTLCGTWWYMSAAIIFILLVPVIYIIAKKIGYLPIIAIVCALPRILNVGYPGGANTYTFIFSVVFGMLFADYNIFEKISNKKLKNKYITYIFRFVVFGGVIILGYFIPYLFDRLNAWELIYGIIPLFFICFSRYCLIRITIIKNILKFLGEHSMTMFLTHTFLRYNYLNEFIYTRGNFMIIYIVLLLLSIVLALAIDLIKRFTKYDKLINKLIDKINDKILSC